MDEFVLCNRVSLLRIAAIHAILIDNTGTTNVPDSWSLYR